MNVSLENGEKINGYMVSNKNGLTQYTINNGRFYIIFETEAGFGRNYFKINNVYDEKTNRNYLSPKYHIKFIPIVNEFSGMLFLRFKDENNLD